MSLTFHFCNKITLFIENVKRASIYYTTKNLLTGLHFMKHQMLVFICVFPCILYINEQWCNTNKCTIFIKNDLLTVLPTCFGLNRPSSGQYFPKITGNYNMSYIQLKCLWLWTTPLHGHTPGIRIWYFNLLTLTHVMILILHTATHHKHFNCI